VSDFLFFAAGVLADAGIPRSRIMSHTGSFFGSSPSPTLLFNSPSAAVTAAAAPGWSLYNQATSPGADAGLEAALFSAEGTPWGAPEWAPFFAGGSQADWEAAFARSLSHRNNRLICVQNWDALPLTCPNALPAIASVVTAPSACFVDTAQALQAAPVNSMGCGETPDPAAQVVVADFGDQPR